MLICPFALLPLLIAVSSSKEFDYEAAYRRIRESENGDMEEGAQKDYEWYQQYYPNGDYVYEGSENQVLSDRSGIGRIASEKPPGQVIARVL